MATNLQPTMALTNSNIQAVSATPVHQIGVAMYPSVNHQPIPGPAQPSSTPLSTLLALYSITQLPTSTPQIQEIIRRKDTPETQKVEDLRRVIQEHTNRSGH